jgi:hypothetical protein
LSYVVILIIAALIINALKITSKLMQYGTTAIGIFFLIMIAQHASETIDFTLDKSEQLYPRMLDLADSIFNSLMHVFDTIRKGGQ